MGSELDFNSVDEMAKVFNKKISLVRTSCEFRKMSDDSARNLRSIEGDVSEVRGIFQEIREEIKTGEDELVKLEVFWLTKSYSLVIFYCKLVIWINIYLILMLRGSLR